MIESIRIKNWMGITDLVIQASAVTVFRGRNGAGKSSILEALKAALSHDHDAAKIRVGAEKAEIELHFSDKNVFRMRTTKKGTTWENIDKTGNKTPVTAAQLKSLYDAISLDPLEFINLPQKEQVQIFLQSCPMKLTPAQWQQYTSYGFTTGLDPDQHALAVIGDEKSGIYGQVYQERTSVNRELKMHKATAANIRASLPAGSGDVDAVQVQLNAASGRLEDLNEHYDQHKSEAENTAAALKESAVEEYNRAFTRSNELYAETRRLIDVQYQQSLAQAQQQHDSEIRQADSIKHAAVVMSETIRSAARDEAENLYRPKIDACRQEIQALQDSLLATQRSATLFEQLAVSEARADEAEQLAAHCTNLLDGLKELRIELASSSPIPGLEVAADGSMVFEGVPYGLLNLAKKLEVAIRIGQLRMKSDHGIMILDNLEHFDSGNLDELLAQIKVAAEALGLQAFGAQVDDNLNLEIDNI